MYSVIKIYVQLRHILRNFIRFLCIICATKVSHAIKSYVMYISSLTCKVHMLSTISCHFLLDSRHKEIQIGVKVVYILYDYNVIAEFK